MNTDAKFLTKNCQPKNQPLKIFTGPSEIHIKDAKMFQHISNQ